MMLWQNIKQLNFRRENFKLIQFYVNKVILSWNFKTFRVYIYIFFLATTIFSLVVPYDLYILIQLYLLLRQLDIQFILVF